MAERQYQRKIVREDLYIQYILHLKLTNILRYKKGYGTLCIFMHNLNNPETTVTNCMSGTTHTDAFTAQY